MSELLKIKLTIADRVYPLSVAPEQEEALRASAKKIEAMIKQLEQSYAVRDKQDVLAMCALQFANQNEQKTIDNTSLNEDLESRLIAVDELLDAHLNDNVL
jgi:cell division protein ZapA (FtsZ GTPase activity inhibitor)